MYNSKKINNPKKNKKVLIVATTFLLIIAVVFSILELSNTTNIFTRSNTNGDKPEQTDIDSNINLNPPTETEVKAGDEQKQAIIDNSQKPIPKTAEVVIVDSSQYNDVVEVRAFASNVVEDGNCTITFSKGSFSFAKEVEAIADASSTPCISLSLPVAEFNENGTWTVTVEFASNNVSGSNQSQMEINK